MNAPLPTLNSPLDFLGTYGVSSHTVIFILFVLIFLVWAFFTLVAIYHWIRYSHAALIALPVIAIHLIVSAILIVFAVSGLA